ncbi:hypothetical protein [Actinoplanes sp. NPDC049118]|uniref:hypothetical protein n=1 Tax=Actinoplanes sp. NPDC049118 TaxID=3155769 RepID=UPI0033F1D62E
MASELDYFAKAAVVELCEDNSIKPPRMDDMIVDSWLPNYGYRPANGSRSAGSSKRKRASTGYLGRSTWVRSKSDESFRAHVQIPADGITGGVEVEILHR